MNLPNNNDCLGWTDIELRDILRIAAWTARDSMPQMITAPGHKHRLIEYMLTLRGMISKKTNHLRTNKGSVINNTTLWSTGGEIIYAMTGNRITYSVMWAIRVKPSLIIRQVWDKEREAIDSKSLKQIKYNDDVFSPCGRMRS